MRKRKKSLLAIDFMPQHIKSVCRSGSDKGYQKEKGDIKLKIIIKQI